MGRLGIQSQKSIYSCIISIVSFLGFLSCWWFFNSYLLQQWPGAHCPTSPGRAFPQSVPAPMLEVPPILMEGIRSDRGQIQSVNRIELNGVQGWLSYKGWEGASHLESHVKSGRPVRSCPWISPFSHVLQLISKIYLESTHTTSICKGSEVEKSFMSYSGSGWRSQSKGGE